MKNLYITATLTLCFYLSPTFLLAQEASEKILIKTVLDTVIWVGMFQTVEVPYTFAQDDEILLSFKEFSGLELSKFEIQQPSAELNMEAEKVTEIKEKFLNISEEGTHIFRFKQNPYFGVQTFKKRVCTLQIKKIIEIKDFVVIDTTLIPQPKKLIKVDTVYQTFLDTMVYVGSELNVNNSQRTTLPIVLPPETNYWTFWMGVENAAINEYNAYQELVVNDWQAASIASAIEAYTLGYVTYFPVNLQGETTTYFFTDGINKDRFVQKRSFTKFSHIKSGQEVRTQYTKIPHRGRQDTVYMCFLNKNNVSGTNVHVKMGALKLSYEYEDQKDSMIVTKKTLSINTDLMSIEAAKDSIEQLKKDLTDAQKKVEEDYAAALKKLEGDKKDELAKLDATQKNLDAEEKKLNEREANIANTAVTSKEDYVKEVMVLRNKLSDAEKKLANLQEGNTKDKKKQKGKKAPKAPTGEEIPTDLTSLEKEINDDIYVGGDVGFSFTDRAFDLRLSPFIANYFIPKLSLGIGPKLSYNRQFNSTSNDKGVLVYGGRAFVRYDVNQNLFAHVELEAMNRMVTVADSTTREWKLGLPIGGGYRQRIGKHSYFNMSFLFDVLNPKTTANRSPLTFRGGVTYDLGAIGKSSIKKAKGVKPPKAPKIPAPPKL